MAQLLDDWPIKIVIFQFAIYKRVVIHVSPLTPLGAGWEGLVSAQLRAQWQAPLTVRWFSFFSWEVDTLLSSKCLHMFHRLKHVIMMRKVDSHIFGMGWNHKPFGLLFIGNASHSAGAPDFVCVSSLVLWYSVYRFSRPHTSDDHEGTDNYGCFSTCSCFFVPRLGLPSLIPHSMDHSRT